MNILPLPAGPFFCAPEGRYLPGLTDLIVQAAALRQRIEIEEQLFKLRLKQKCFVALAERAPQAVMISASETQGIQIQVQSTTGKSSLILMPHNETSDTQTTARTSAGVFNPFEHYPKGRW